MNDVQNIRTAEPYRNPTPGIQARLAELRAAWSARATAALGERSDVLREQGEQVARARALALGELLVTFAALTLWICRLAQPDAEPTSKCGASSVLAAPLLLVLVVLPLGWLARHARGRGGRGAIAHAARWTAEPCAGGTSVELERLANETPDARLDGFVRRLRGQNRLWSQLATGLALVLLPVLIAAADTDPTAMADAAFVAMFPLGMLAIGLVLAIAPRLVSSWWAALPLGAVLGLFIVASHFGAPALVLVVVQASVVVQRLTVE
jgi:hypothetical protein